ncbi:MAG: NnrS family protein [Methylophaga sp.]
MNDKSAPLPVSSALFALAFRPLFLGAAALSVLSLLIWGLSLSGWQFKPYGGVQFWHGHEMLFGFVGAVIVGFLLTAVQSWTGLRSVNGRPLMYLLLLWLLARVLMAVPIVPEMLIVFVDLLFFPAAAMFLFIPLLVRNQTRNYFAVLALFLLMVCNGLSHFAVINNQPELQSQALYSAVLLITLMMAIIGGRVIPMFTANTTGKPAKNRHVWLDRIALSALWALLILSLLAPAMQLPAALLSALFAVSAVLLGWRCANWRFFTTLTHPLLSSLHLGYWWIVIGLLLFSGHYAGLDIPASIALHSLSAGAMGLLILSMMCRVSLGHTGRPIVASCLMTVSLWVVLIAAFIRVFGVWLLPEFSQQLLLVGVGFWSIAYAMFLFTFVPVLSQPRADGKAE